MAAIISSPRHTDATTSSANGGSIPYLHRKAPAVWRVNRCGVLISPFIHVTLVVVFVFAVMISSDVQVIMCASKDLKALHNREKNENS